MNESSSSSDRLVTFCQGVLSRYQDSWPPTEEALAEEFARFFEVNLVLAQQFLEFCSELDIQVSFAALPEGLHGINGCLGGKRGVVLAEKETFPGGKVHTLLHEIRELLEYIFVDLDYPTAQGAGLEHRAEHFASTVRMNGANQMVGELLDSAKNIEVNWKRWAALGGILAFGLFFISACESHSHLEDAIIRAKRRDQR